MLRHAACLHLTSSNDQCLLPGMITSLRSKFMTFSFHHSRLITSWWERVYRICRLWVITANASRICDLGARVRTGLKSTWIYRAVLNSLWKLNLPWKVLEKHSKALKSPWFLPFTGGFNSVFGDLNQYKIVMPFLVQHMLHQIKAPKFYTNYLKLISLVMDS